MVLPPMETTLTTLDHTMRAKLSDLMKSDPFPTSFVAASFTLFPDTSFSFRPNSGWVAVCDGSLSHFYHPGKTRTEGQYKKNPRWLDALEEGRKDFRCFVINKKLSRTLPKLPLLSDAQREREREREIDRECELSKAHFSNPAWRMCLRFVKRARRIQLAH